MNLRHHNYPPDAIITHWTIPLLWWDHHTTSDLTYHVRLSVPDSAALNTAWEILGERYTAHDGELWIGGASLRRVDPEHLVALSGGEDALESLEWAINDFLDALAKDGMGAKVISEARISSPQH